MQRLDNWIEKWFGDKGYERPKAPKYPPAGPPRPIPKCKPRLEMTIPPYGLVDSDETHRARKNLIEAAMEAETLLTNYLVNEHFPRGSDCEDVLNLLTDAITRVNFSVQTPCSEITEPILEDVKQESLTYIDDKGIERLNSDNTFYGISSDKSKVYHILGQFNLASVAESLCNFVEIGLDKALDEIPTDKRLCKLCEKEMKDGI